MKKIVIEGMHCDACKKLIMMELKDADLDTYIDSLYLDQKNVGILTVKDNVFLENVSRIEKLINDMDGYSIVKN